jgi:hypothetical protein
LVLFITGKPERDKAQDSTTILVRFVLRDAYVMPINSPSKQGATHVPKLFNLIEACRAPCHASAAAICHQLSKASASQKAVHFGAADASGWTPLLYAARNGWPDVVEACLAAGQNSSPHTARLQSSGNTGVPLAPYVPGPSLSDV